MTLAGSGGHAREIYDVLVRQQYGKPIFAFEETASVNTGKWDALVSCIAGNEELVKRLQVDPAFILATGNPLLREKFYNMFIVAGGRPSSLIAETAVISKLHVVMEEALNVMHMVFISNNVHISKGALLNTGCRIHHDCFIGAFTEISPNVTITGNCKIGSFCSIGASATVLPGITIGDHAVVGAGAVVTKNIPAGTTFVGIPARIIR